MRYRLGGSTCISILSPRPSKQLQHAVYTLVALSGTTSAVGRPDIAAAWILKFKAGEKRSTPNSQNWPHLIPKTGRGPAGASAKE